MKRLLGHVPLLLVLLLVVAVLVFHGCQTPSPVPPISVKYTNVYYFPIVFTPTISRKGIAGFGWDTPAQWSSLGVDSGYNWNYVCPNGPVNVRECINSVRSNPDMLYRVSFGNGSGNNTQAEI